MGLEVEVASGELQALEGAGRYLRPRVEVLRADLGVIGAAYGRHRYRQGLGRMIDPITKEAGVGSERRQHRFKTVAGGSSQALELRQ